MRVDRGYSLALPFGPCQTERSVALGSASLSGRVCVEVSRSDHCDGNDGKRGGSAWFSGQ